MLIEVNNQNSPFKDLWLYESCYTLNNDLFTTELKKQTLRTTGLGLIGLDDWWSTIKTSNPEYTWKQLVELALNILNSEATRLLCHTMWLKKIPNVEIKDFETINLPTHHINITKRIHISCSITDFGSGEHKMMQKYMLFGENVRSRVEGNWMHWIRTALAILADQNTEKVAPELYCLDFKIKE